MALSTSLRARENRFMKWNAAACSLQSSQLHTVTSKKVGFTEVKVRCGTEPEI